MVNYEYIIASLPAVSREWTFGEGKSLDTYVEWIKSQLSPKDIKTVDKLLDGLKEENLSVEFYDDALKDSNRFIREFFTFDLCFRNVKARFVNKVFGRPVSRDTIDLETGEFPEGSEIDEVMSGKDIFARERGLDSIRWNKINELTTFNYFDIDAILAVIAKMSIIERWRKLDPETGLEMFQNLIDETRGTYGGVNYVVPANE
ncbi:MAG: DUF2764 family protein [Bacteroidales bacterium]|nr:DUF2764 family protein [Bacteroidales bacterium]